MKNKIYSKLIILLMVVSLLSYNTNAQSRGGWQGTYNTDFGVVKLHHEGNRVYGDYSSVGIIDANVTATTTSSGTISGTFTNKGKEGSFTFTSSGNKITGTWKFLDNSRSGAWNGTKTSSEVPKLESHHWSGAWTTSFNEDWTLKQQGRIVNAYLNGKMVLAGRLEPSLNEFKGVVMRDNQNYQTILSWKDANKRDLWAGRMTQNNQSKGSIWGKSKSLTTGTQAAQSTVNPSGLFQVRITRILPSNISEASIFSLDADIYGTIGIRAYSKGSSGQVEIKALNNLAPRVWDVSSSNPAKAKITQRVKVIGEDGKENWNRGEIQVDKIRQFRIAGENANNTLEFNIQSNLSEADFGPDDNFKWQQRSINVSKMKTSDLGKPMFITHRKGDQVILVEFVIDKID